MAKRSNISADDLRGQLFQVLEDLNNENNTTEETDALIKKADAVSNIAKNIIDLAKVEAQVLGTVLKHSRREGTTPKIESNFFSPLMPEQKQLQ
jgi:hypothetical protein